MNSPNLFSIAIYESSLLPERNESQKKLLNEVRYLGERVACSVNQAVREIFIYLLDMEDLQQINWSCIEITKTKKRFIETVRSFRAHRKINGGASFRWSFGLLSAWSRIESTTNLTTHPSLELKTDTQFIYTVREALNRTVKGTQLFPLNNVGDIVGLDGHEGKNYIVGYTIWIILNIT